MSGYLVCTRKSTDSYSTEVGHVMNSKRAKGDIAWNYMRPLPSAKPYIWMKSLGNDIHELVILDGLRSKVISNSDEPPGSFHTKDLFVKHPTIPDAWKNIGRLDDRVTLVNGEKVLPLPIEGKIRQHFLVREAVVFGVGREVPGLLLFRNEKAVDFDDHEFVGQVWPLVEEANASAETFSQLSRDMVVPLPENVAYAQTDKGTAIRPSVYQVFEKEILNAYSTRDGEDRTATVRLELAELKVYLLQCLNDILKLEVQDDSDLFTAGLDSLKAIQLSRRIRNDPQLGVGTLRVDQNIIFEQRTVGNLAIYLCSRQNDGANSSVASAEDTMEQLVASHSIFKSWSGSSEDRPSGHHVVRP